MMLEHSGRITHLNVDTWLNIAPHFLLGMALAVAPHRERVTVVKNTAIWVPTATDEKVLPPRVDDGFIWS